MKWIFLAAIFIWDFSFGQINRIDSLSFAEVKGKKQFYLVKGNAAPLIVFINGLGPSMEDFFKIQDKLSMTTQVLCYDRAGIGRSESIANDRSLENISDELKELLDKIGLNKPMILVGHSRGGLIARYYANKYPDHVLGLILIDPAIPELKWKKRELRTPAEKIEFDRYYNSFSTDSTKYSATIRSEFKAQDSSAIADKRYPLNIPVSILASNKETQDKYSKQETKIKVGLVNGYMKAAPHIKLIWTKKSGHFIHEDEPGLVVNEILLMVKQVR